MRSNIGLESAMNCLEISDLESLALDTWSASDSAPFAFHLTVCNICRDRLNEVRENLRTEESLRRISRPSERSAPRHIGAFEILREIGRGGMGRVYEAQQKHPHRRVAIKVLNAGFSQESASERMFRREAEALGRLKHPCIAAIHEAGTSDDGRAYLVMELVEGVSLRQWASLEKRSLRDRLTLFHRICEAIAYAHQRGVIHRDLKPSNILICDDCADAPNGESLIEGMHGSQSPHAFPKILDFGLAKFVEPGGAEGRSILTEVGRIHGTLPYMSPEQVRGDTWDVDVRSDVYSLGVILYELISGRLPYALERAPLPEAARIICETAPPDLRSLNREAAGDLETIVRKALEKEPDRRYSGAAALAEDLQRYLGDQPILARPPTLTYQVRKLVRRHRALSALIVAMFILTTGLGISMSILYAKANRESLRAKDAERVAQEEASRARQQAQTATRVKDLLVGIFRVSDPDVAKGRSITARELLDNAAFRIDQMRDEPATQAALLQSIGTVYQNLGLNDSAKPLLERALAIFDTRPDEFSKEISEITATLGEVYFAYGELVPAEAYYRRSLAIIRSRLGDSDWHVADLMSTLVNVLRLRGDFDGAEELTRESIEILRRSPHSEVTLPKALNSLAGMLEALDRPAEALPYMREALAIIQKNGKSQGTQASIQNNLARLLLQLNLMDEAEINAVQALEIRRRVLPPGHPAIGTSLSVVGLIQMKRGELADAEAGLSEAVLIHRGAGSAPNDLCEAMSLHGECLAKQGRLEEAEPILVECRQRMIDANADARSLRSVESVLIELYETRGSPEKAQAIRTGVSAEAASLPKTDGR